MARSLRRHATPGKMPAEERNGGRRLSTSPRDRASDRQKRMRSNPMLRLAAPTSSPVVSRVPTRPRRSASRPLRTIFVVALAGLLGAPVLADARITRIEISRVESPTFEGKSFGDVGQYEKLVGRVFGEIDPTAPRNAVIVDILLAQRNARGMVEYSADLYILKPLDSSRGNGRVFFEVNNRGRLLSFRQIHDVRSGGGDPTAAEDAGNGFLMRQGAIPSCRADGTSRPGLAAIDSRSASRWRPTLMARRSWARRSRSSSSTTTRR